MPRRPRIIAGLIVAGLALPVAGQSVGPYNAVLTAGGDGVTKPVGVAAAAQASSKAAIVTTLLPASSEWTLQAWIEPESLARGTVLVAGLGDPAAGRFLALVDGRPALVTTAGTVVGTARLVPGGWHHVAAVVSGGAAVLYVDGVASGRGRAASTAVLAVARIGPREDGMPPFAGRVAGFGQVSSALPAATLRKSARTVPDPMLVDYDRGSRSWPVQTRQMAGQVVPQDAWTRPTSSVATSMPAAKPLPTGPALAARAPNLWTVGGWRLAAAPTVAAGGAALSKTDYDARKWYAATVPGTVLTTLVDRGVYPDPAYGLNNLAIPESLNKQDYWYRTEIDVHADATGKRLRLDFNGVNYAAEVWVNGDRLGTIKGAFIRGRFDATGKLVPGRRNAIAVRVSPPPHPGLAHEESLTAGVGENGGMSMLDGPTFVAAEGWDWIPSIRDRNTGLWQGVDLVATGDVRIGDAQVVTTLPKADNSVADVEIDVPLVNQSDRPQTGDVRAAFDGVVVTRQVTLAPGATTQIKFTPAEFPALRVAQPRLWWPNGYGAPNLHDLTLTSTVAGQVSDSKAIRFGMRQVTYELSLMDQKGALRRVAVDLSKARSLGQQIVDGTHDAIRKVPDGWAASFVAGAEKSPAVTPIADARLAPYLVLRVNGVRIAARGGNIGMDDLMKRTERSRLEPFFRLHREANLNIVRNWVGQNTQESFYDLADEHGMMILNDFWESTQDYNIEAQDVPLFTANAEDVVRRFRNHPSIVVWFGRNEGVPQPILNAALEDIVNRDDGTRLYMGSSNKVNLQDSGPYNWRPPVEYFTRHARGFSVESGTPSFPTLESWSRAMPAADRWPISDTWAYHDWHQTGNGAVTTYMDTLGRRFGAGTSLADFERKAQMMQYESYRAIFEGFNAGLWTTNSARMLWMTQPAWPSSAWQIFSSEYDTHASFYGVRKASQPVHVQMNLPDFKVIVVNNTRSPLARARVHAKVTTLDNRLLADRTAMVSATAGSTASAFTLDLAPMLARGMVLVSLDVTDAKGQRLSDNFYWQGNDDAAYRGLTTLAAATLTATATSRPDGGETVTTVDLANPATVAALATKLTLFDAAGKQVLPAYFSDNYVSLLPGETRRIEVRAPGAAATVAVRGWNVTPASIAVAPR